MSGPLRVGIIGMGGFAGSHHDAVLRLEADGECRLVCTCDPRMDAFAERRQALAFEGRGVRTFADYQEMLNACAAELDVVTIPTPVPLHPPMHRACVEQGLAVYLEKPPTLDYAILEQMIEVDSRARRQTSVGFNFVVEAGRQALKRRLVSGEFGPLHQVTLHYLAARPDRYFTRAAWAARLMQDGQLVLDSCIGNAMAHHVHNGLFWCGQEGLWSWGQLVGVAAEVYRAHAIEGIDTAFVQAAIAGGSTLRVAMSHACAVSSSCDEVVECEQAVIRYTINQSPGRGQAKHLTVHWRDGREERLAPGDSTLDHNLRVYFRHVRSGTERPMTRLADCRPFVHLNGLAYVAAGRITTIPAEVLKRVPEASGGTFLAIPDLTAIAQRFIASGEFPSDQRVAWAGQGGYAAAADLPRLRQVVEQMLYGMCQ